MAFELCSSPEEIDTSLATTATMPTTSQTAEPTSLLQASSLTTPPASRRSSTSSDTSTSMAASHSSDKARRRSNLSLDLSDLPPLITPSPPSNTLIITNLHDPVLLKPSSIAHLRDLITSQLPANAAIYSLSPLRGLKRIIISFTTTEAAIHIRMLLDNTNLLDTRIRVYFGAATPLNPDDDTDSNPRYLKAPKAQKQFFISPPPSPPAGWEMREEGAPNKEVHAIDLMRALERRVGRGGNDDDTQDGVTTGDTDMKSTAPSDKPHTDNSATAIPKRQTSIADETEDRRKRTRSGSSAVLVYEPEELGLSPLLPMIAVEDTGAAEDEDERERERLDEYRYMRSVDDEMQQPGKIMAHTARPPVELMVDH